MPPEIRLLFARKNLKKMQTIGVNKTYMLKKRHIFTTVFDKISEATEAYGAVHNSCRLKIGTKITSYSLRYGRLQGN